MVNDLEGFDAEQVEPMGSYQTLPKGDYKAVCVKVGWQDTKAKTGQYLQLDWQVTDGEYRGAGLTSRLNLKNQNATAVRIAQQELSSICRAVDVLRPKSSDELANKVAVLKVDVEERNDKPGAYSNRIIGYDVIGGQPAPAPAPASAPVAPWRAK